MGPQEGGTRDPHVTTTAHQPQHPGLVGAQPHTDVMGRPRSRRGAVKAVMSAVKMHRLILGPQSAVYLYGFVERVDRFAGGAGRTVYSDDLVLHLLGAHENAELKYP